MGWLKPTMVNVAPPRWYRGAMRALIVLECLVAVVGCGASTQPAAPSRTEQSGHQVVSEPPVEDDDPTSRAAETIVIGQFASMTGPNASLALGSFQGVKLAVNERNAAGGVNGRAIRLVTADTQSTPAGTFAAVTRLVSEERAVALVGEVASSLSLVGAELAQKHDVPMITPASTNPTVTQVGDHVFRACFLDAFQGEAVARLTHDRLKLGKVGVLSDSSGEYGKTLAQSFATRFTELGGKVVAREEYASGDTSVRKQLLAIQRAGAQAVFLAGYYLDAGRFLPEARKLGMKQMFLGGDGLESPELVALGGKSVDGVHYASHFASDDPRPEARRFVTAYRAEYDTEPDGLAALGYDAAQLLFHAITEAKSLSGGDISAALAATQAFPGVTGSIGMNRDRNPEKPATIIEIQNGKPRFRASISPR